MTDAVAALIDHVRFGKVRPVSLDRRWNVDPRQGSPPLETLLASVAAASSVPAAIDALKPSHFIYAGLKRALAAQKTIVAAGGWPVIPPGAALKPGATNQRIVAVRKRLAATGELRVASDDARYDDEVVAAVKQFQERHRLNADGVIGRTTLDALNVTAEDPRAGREGRPADAGLPRGYAVPRVQSRLDGAADDSGARRPGADAQGRERD